MEAISTGGLGSSAALVRAAEAMLRSLGGSEVVLRMKGAVDVGTANANPRLGLVTNVGEDVVLAPAVVRDTGDGAFEVVISGRAVEEQVEQRQTGSGEALFEMALGFAVSGKVLRIEEVAVDSFGGVPYLYRVKARE